MSLLLALVSSGSYSLTAATGAFGETGSVASLTAQRRLTTEQGAFGLTGFAALLKAGRTVTAAQGAYALAGQAALPTVQRRLTSTQGGYTLSGQAALWSRAVRLTAALGTLALTGQAAGLTTQRGLTSSAGTFTLAGQAVGLTVDQVLGVALPRTLIRTDETYRSLVRTRVNLRSLVSLALAREIRRMPAPSRNAARVDGQRTLTLTGGGHMIAGTEETIDMQLSTGGNAQSLVGWTDVTAQRSFDHSTWAACATTVVEAATGRVQATIAPEATTTARAGTLFVRVRATDPGGKVRYFPDDAARYVAVQLTR